MLSRMADSLYWMARYLERAEHTSRMLAVELESTVERTTDDAEASWARVTAALLTEPFAGTHDAFPVTSTLAFGQHTKSSLATSLRLARDNARQVRQQLSTEVWEKLNGLYLRLQHTTAEDIWVHQPSLFFRRTMDDLYVLGGLLFTTLRHGEGWFFLELGRYIERAQLVSRLLDIHFGVVAPGYDKPPPDPKYLDWLVLLKFCLAFEPYCREHTASIKPELIAEMLLFDAEFPHSVRFSIDRVCEALENVAPGAPPARRARAERLAGRLKAAVDFGRIDEFTADSIDTFLVNVSRQCENIHQAVYASYIAYDVEAVL